MVSPFLMLGGIAYVKEGGLSAEWVTRAPSGVESLVHHDRRIGRRRPAHDLSITSGNRTVARNGPVGGSRVGVVLTDGPAPVKQGRLNPSGVTVW